MFKPFLTRWTWLAAAVALAQASCCTLIGLGIGAGVDVGKPRYVIIPGWAVETVKPGTTITVSLLLYIAFITHIFGGGV